MGISIKHALGDRELNILESFLDYYQESIKVQRELASNLLTLMEQMEQNHKMLNKLFTAPPDQVVAPTSLNDRLYQKEESEWDPLGLDPFLELRER